MAYTTPLLIDESYFVRNMEMTDAYKDTSGNVFEEASNNYNSDLANYMALYQKKFLYQMFGATLADNMPQELIDLIVIDSTKESPIANFVYFYYTREKKKLMPAVQGQNAEQYKRAQLQTSNENLCNVFNEMVDFVTRVHRQLLLDETITIFAGTDDERVLEYTEILASLEHESRSIYHWINSLDI